MTRRIADVAASIALSLTAAAIAAVVYGGHAGLLTLALLGPLGILTVLAGHAVAARRERVGGLRRQFLVIAVVAVAQLAIAVVLNVALMFVSAKDAFFTVLFAVYTALMALWAARMLGRRALADIDRIRATLREVGRGRRDVRAGIAGGDELARLGAEVDAMVARQHQEEQARRTLLAAVSHDLRTPLSTLGLLAAAIEDDIGDPETRRQYARRLTTHVRALSSLIDDLFELTRLESGELTWTLQRVELDQLLHETIDAMRPAASARDIRVSTELAPALEAARANPEKLQRVLFNLIQNAIRHTPADGAVTVRAECVGREVEIEVADTGSGIPAAERRRVFEPFYRGDETGTGLGLAISRAIVEAHGGRIWVHDAHVGTSVRLRVPIHDGAAG